MKELFLTAAFLLVLSGTAMAQKGTAEAGYYPPEYGGDTWTGEVAAINESSREFTLTYGKGDNIQTFVGILAKGYRVKMKDGKDYELKMGDLNETRLTAYYMTKSKKGSDGVKVKTNEVFKIKFLPKDK